MFNIDKVKTANDKKNRIYFCGVYYSYPTKIIFLSLSYSIFQHNLQILIKFLKLKSHGQKKSLHHIDTL